MASLQDLVKATTDSANALKSAQEKIDTLRQKIADDIKTLSMTWENDGYAKTRDGVNAIAAALVTFDAQVTQMTETLNTSTKKLVDVGKS